jgi:hypothetical protein
MGVVHDEDDGLFLCSESEQVECAEEGRERVPGNARTKA